MDSTIYIYMIVALLPLAAAMVLFQQNPYHALVIRGILGAIAALVYSLLGAADVALTEALVGTLLAITLYAIAVRSSLILRLGVLKPSQAQELTIFADLQRIFKNYYLRIEEIVYPSPEALAQALVHKEVHVTYLPWSASSGAEMLHSKETVTTRLPYLYEVMRDKLEPQINLHLSPPAPEKVASTGGQH
jgi:putative multicomponent Na+:H+ antiporter subunit B